MRRFSRFRRYSATPRRRWFGRSQASQGTLTPRLQQCQFSINGDFIMLDDTTLPTDPSFLIQAMMPWSNLSNTGYDRSLFIHGIVWNLELRPTSYLSNSAGSVWGLPPVASVAIDQQFAAMGAWWFIDTWDPDTEAPVSYLNAPRGPFTSLPPLTTPGSQPTDGEALPVRVLKRKSSLVQTSVHFTDGATTERDQNASSGASFQWSGVLRKRVACDDRQALFFGIHCQTPAGWGAATDAASLNFAFFLNGVFYYKLRR